jgi:hypothetical protein
MGKHNFYHLDAVYLLFVFPENILPLKLKCFVFFLAYLQIISLFKSFKEMNVLMLR